MPSTTGFGMGFGDFGNWMKKKLKKTKKDAAETAIREALTTAVASGATAEERKKIVDFAVAAAVVAVAKAANGSINPFMDDTTC